MALNRLQVRITVAIILQHDGQKVFIVRRFESSTTKIFDSFLAESMSHLSV